MKEQAGADQASGEQTETKPAPDRKARLAEQLRANLQRRKAQARSRRTGDADQRPDGLAAGQDPASDTRSTQD
ncbi:MAG: hypothetical protein KF810_19660 [Rhizobiaceae bacterium]|nr:hypothetical protein [Rhizobiaceae bacterium]